MIGFSILLLLVLGLTNNWIDSVFTGIAFIIGSLTSVLSGFAGMKIGVFANARTAIESQKGLDKGFYYCF